MLTIFCMNALAQQSVVDEASTIPKLTKSFYRFYIYTPVTGNASTLASGIFISNSNSRVKTNKADTLGSRKSPLNYTWAEYYSHNPEDLSDSTKVSDSTNTLSRYFDVSLFPIGSEMSYRHSIIERKTNGRNFYKTDTTKTYTVKEIAGNPLYDVNGFPLFSDDGILLYLKEN